LSDHLMIVLSNVKDGQEEEFNRWYTDEHIVDVVEKLPGFASAQRYELSPGQPDAEEYRYLVVYRIPEDRLDEARASQAYQRRERPKAVAEGRRPMLTVSDTMKPPHKTWFFSPITDEVRAAQEPAPLPPAAD
jgi:antibiotic biosynthesis monooxygenase (ABM) superfamily enzyme